MTEVVSAPRSDPVMRMPKDKPATENQPNAPVGMREAIPDERLAPERCKSSAAWRWLATNGYPVRKHFLCSRGISSACT